MTEAPEAIWAWALDKFNGNPFWAGDIKVSHTAREGAIEYCRADPQPETPKGVTPCYDCGREYGDEHGFPDLFIPHEDWAKISPTSDEGGLLCPSCICKRLHDKGIETAGKFTSGPLCADLPPKEADRGVHSDLIERMRVTQKALLNGDGIESAVNVLMEAAICLDKAGGYGSLETTQ